MRDPNAYDFYSDFNDIRVDGTVVTYADELTRAVTVGEQLVAGDGEGNRCPATVKAIDGTRITLQLDLDQFQAAPFERPAE